MSIRRTTDRTGMSTAPGLPVGTIVPYAASTTILNAVLPANWLLCSGAAVSRTTNGSLFGCPVPLMGNPTIWIASPAIVMMTAATPPGAARRVIISGVPTARRTSTLWRQPGHWSVSSWSTGHRFACGVQKLRASCGELVFVDEAPD
jgi:hypothetical protein